MVQKCLGRSTPIYTESKSEKRDRESRIFLSRDGAGRKEDQNEDNLGFILYIEKAAYNLDKLDRATTLDRGERHVEG